VAPGNYLVHLHCHTWPENTIPELPTGGNNYIKTYRPDNCNTPANTDDDLIDITYTSYSIYSNEVLLQWCEMNWVPPGSHASGGLPGWSSLHPKSMTLIIWNCNVFFAPVP
jgi:hypothetical protein